MTVLGNIERSAVGLCQVLFQRVSPAHNWHGNVERLLDMEFVIKLASSWQSAQRYAQQAPSGDLRHMATDTELKAHKDKPLLAAALRLAVIGAGVEAPTILRALGTFGNLLQHGGRPLQWVSDEEYRSVLDAQHLREMLLRGHAHRAGFLVNSCELCSLAHIPAVAVAEDRPAPIAILETLPVDPSDSVGTLIGTCDVAGENRPVRIAPSVRRRHTHIIGATDHGKSTLMEHMILQDIEAGQGVAVIDPHGSLVDELLCLIRPEASYSEWSRVAILSTTAPSIAHLRPSRKSLQAQRTLLLRPAIRRSIHPLRNGRECGTPSVVADA